MNYTYLVLIVYLEQFYLAIAWKDAAMYPVPVLYLYL